MRKVIFGGAVSLDFYFADAGEKMDWLLWSDDAAAITKDSWRGVDTMLMGRKTYEFAARSGGGGGGPSGLITYVFSRTMSEAPEGAELVSEDAAGFVRALKARDGGNIILMGGGDLGSALIEAGLVDEIGLNIHPIILGSGIPVFRPMDRRVALELIESRPIARGCVLARYRPADARR